MASQMTDAQIEKTEVNIKADGIKEEFLAKGEVIIFEGFLKAYQSAKQADPNILPDMVKGDELKNEEINVEFLTEESQFI